MALWKAIKRQRIMVTQIHTHKDLAGNVSETRHRHRGSVCTYQDGSRTFRYREDGREYMYPLNEKNEYLTSSVEVKSYNGQELLDRFLGKIS